jgi:hypothetical protein
MSEQDLRETAADWSTAIYKLAEQVGVNVDPLKENYVCELCSVGLHKLAQEVMNNELFQPLKSRVTIVC